MKWSIAWLTCVQVALLLCASTLPGFAGPFNEELSKCILAQLTEEDRGALVRWHLAAVSQHPAVSPTQRATPEQVEAANRAVGELTMRLLTDSCRVAASNAAKHERATIVQEVGRILSQELVKEVFGNPTVFASIQTFRNYIDTTKLDALEKDDTP